MNEQYSRMSQLLHRGDGVKGIGLHTESLPVYTTTAFTWNSLYEAQAAYAAMEKGEDYTYIRTCNPNRDALAEGISFLEGGEDTLICSSGMGAITSTLLTILKPGDHVVYSNCCYGETLDVMRQLLTKFGVETTAVAVEDAENVRRAMRPNTRLVYTEVVANPCMNVADIPLLVKLAHEGGALMMVDNTFTTPYAIRPLALGADIVVNSLTKFLNGHSDAIAGAVTANRELIAQIKPVNMYCGTPADPFSSWLVSRSLRTAELRIPRQMRNAASLAAALEANSAVKKVFHPSLKSAPGHQAALGMFADPAQMCGMLSIELPEDMDKINDFMSRLQLAHYAPTLGGVRTTYQHPCTSSHSHTPDEERRQAGITPGLIRISVGVEEAADLIADFTQALNAFA